MATPNLDKELLRLRIRIGDTYTSTGVVFTTSTSNLNLDGSAVTAAELAEIYNQSIREFIRLMTSTIPKIRWGYLLPGYIVAVPSIGIETTLNVADFSADFIKMANVKSGETVHTIIELRAVAATPLVSKSGHNIGVYFPPNMLQEVLSQSNEVYKNQTMYTIMNTSINASYSSAIVIVPKSTVLADAKYSIIFLKNHVDLVQGSATDLSYADIPQSTLDVILNLAEREYISRRQFDDFGINAQRVNETINVIGR